MTFSLHQIISFSIIILFSLILSIQDIKRKSVNLIIIWAAIACALGCQIFFLRKAVFIYLISSLIMGIFYLIVRKITRNKLGPADVIFGFFQGLFITPFFIPVCLGAEALAAIILLFKKPGKQPFPFIPFMSFGLLVCFIAEFI